MRWKSFRYQLEAAACHFLLWAVPKLPRNVCMVVSSFLGSLAFLIDRRGRKIAEANLVGVFGELYSATECRAIARASYRNFIRTMFDLFWVSRLTPENIQRWAPMEGMQEVVDRAASEKRGIIFLCIHQGNWEWSNLSGGYFGVKNITVVENFKNPLLTEIFKRLREHTGATIIPQENSLLRMMKCVKRQGSTGMLADLNLRPSQAATVIEAFRGEHTEGFRMCVPILHAVLASRAGALLVPAETRPMPDGSCRIIVYPPLETQPGESYRAITQRCWDFYEPIIRARPELYLWAYKHFRYRPKHTARTYPYYANENGKFERLLKEGEQALAK